jgi:hypothetical protein
MKGGEVEAAVRAVTIMQGCVVQLASDFGKIDRDAAHQSLANLQAHIGDALSQGTRTGQSKTVADLLLRTINAMFDHARNAVNAK